MQIGDLVRWDGTADLNAARPDTGIVVDGPRDSYSTSYGAWGHVYAVAWFDCKETMWHNDYNLELLSESR